MLFSSSKKFSDSNQFSHSNPFSLSNKFSSSVQFSESQAFSPSITLKPNDPKCKVFTENENFNLYECIFSVNEPKLYYIYVISSNFTNYKQQKESDDEKGGSAIHLINCGIMCNKTLFDRCISPGGGGGAVYIVNSFDITNNATFEDAHFIQCKADYGGAIFISANSEFFNITFTRCIFDSNEALLKTKSSGEKSYLFGGSAIYIMNKNLNAVNCTFSMNKGPGGAVKIYNLFNTNTKKIKLDQSESLISFIGCNFEQHENSDSSIFYEDKNNGNKLDVHDCNFKGKLKKGSHYIDGKVNNNKKLHVESCNFENDKNKSIIINLIDNLSTIEANIMSNSIQISYNLKIIIGIVIMISFALFVFLILKLNGSSDKYQEHDTLFIENKYDMA